MGHSKGVHDIDFDNSGAQFMSAAYDRQMKLWDTETGTFALSCELDLLVPTGYSLRDVPLPCRPVQAGILERQDPVLHPVPS